MRTVHTSDSRSRGIFPTSGAVGTGGGEVGGGGGGETSGSSTLKPGVASASPLSWLHLPQVTRHRFSEKSVDVSHL